MATNEETWNQVCEDHQDAALGAIRAIAYRDPVRAHRMLLEIERTDLPQCSAACGIAREPIAKRLRREIPDLIYGASAVATARPEERASR